MSSSTGGNPHPQSLRVTLHTGHGLKSADSNGLSDPYCIVYHQPGSGSTQKKHKKKMIGRTPIHYETLDPVWEFSCLLPQVFSNDLIYFEVWDYDLSSKDDFLGHFVTVLDAIWAENTRRPLVLQPRPGKKDSGITGFIQVSFDFGDPIRAASLKSSKRAFVTTKSFTAFSVLGEITSSSSTGSLKGAKIRHSVSVSSEISDYNVNTHEFSFHLTVHAASSLNQDNAQSCDPYVIVSLINPGNALGQEKQKMVVARSHIVFKSTYPRFDLNVTIPKVVSNQVVDIELRSWDQLNRDKFIGHCVLTFPSTPPIHPLAELALALLPREGKRKDKKITGTVLLSFTAGPVLVSSSMSSTSTDTVDYEALPSLYLHKQNYGVSVANFRDIGGWPVKFTDRETGLTVFGRMKTMMIFRTSAINRATEHDAHIIIRELGIKTLFDLRTPDYAGNRGPYLSPYFTVQQPHCKRGSTLWTSSNQAIVINPEDFSNTVKVSESQLSNVDDETRQNMDAAKIFEGAHFDYKAESAATAAASVEWGNLYLQGLVGSKFRRAMISKTKKRNLIRAGLAASTPQQQRRIICGPIFDPPDGITILYLMIVEDCKFEINRLMHSFLDVATYPLAYFCNHGKDRTGLTTVFLHSICGVDRETIVDSYQLSDYFLTPIKDIVDAEMTDGGLLPQVMSRTPARALRSTFLFLDSKYGGVCEYLLHIGFSYDRQDELRRLLIEPSPDFTPERLRWLSTSLTAQVREHCVVTIHSAQGLAIADQTGFSDPYVIIKKTSEIHSVRASVGSQEIGRTNTIPQELNPTWDFKIDVFKIDAATQFTFEVWDEDCGSDDFLGQAIFSTDFRNPWANNDHLRLDLRPRTVGDRVSGTLTISITHD